MAPPVSKAQNRFMQAAAASPKTAKQLGVPQSVAQEYTSGLLKGAVSKLPARKTPKGK